MPEPDVARDGSRPPPLPFVDIGSGLGPYRLTRRLGRGGFSQVFAASHAQIPGREVAIKVLDPLLTRDPKLQARFVREVDAASRLTHPNVLVMGEVDVTAEGHHYCVMELSHGRSLRSVLREHGRLAPARAVQLVRQVLAALSHAHERGVVHRDMKPENVLVEICPRTGEELARVLDFGLAKLTDEATRTAFTTPGQVLGTFQYMAPEQAEGREGVDGRADQYQTAVMLYELLSGELPFREGSKVAYAVAHLTKPPPRLVEAHPGLGLPAALDDALQRALEKEPADRFPDASAFAEAISRAVEGLAPSTVAFTAASDASTFVSPKPGPLEARVAEGDGDRLGPGDEVGRYLIEGVIGRGGMGSVYRARHAFIGRESALKVLLPAVAKDPVVRERFLREARVASRVRHPAVALVYDFDDKDGLCYLAMELCQGETLSALIARTGALDAQRAGRIFSQLLGALAAAHDGGVIHRDLKPQNIMVAAGDRVKVLDFGIARILDPAPEEGGDQGLTRGDFVGTPAYAAPEQIEGGRVDARTDIYASGVILFELLSGRRPFLADEPRGYLVQHVFDTPPALSTVRPGLAGALDGIVARALAKDPAARFRTATAMREQLHAALGLGELTPATERHSASEIARAAALSDESESRPPPRGVLEVRGVPGVCRVFLFGGDRLCFGRGREDRRRGIVNDVVLRVLPCVDEPTHPENWAASLRISQHHGEIRIDRTRARIFDRGSRGLRIDGRPLGARAPADLPSHFRLDLGRGALLLTGRVLESEAVLLKRVSNTPEHAYALVAGALVVGSGPEAGLVLDPDAPAHLLSIAARADGFHVVVPPKRGLLARLGLGDKLLLDDRPLTAGESVGPLAAGQTLRRGDLELAFADLDPRMFSQP